MGNVFAWQLPFPGEGRFSEHKKEIATNHSRWHALPLPPFCFVRLVVNNNLIHVPTWRNRITQKKNRLPLKYRAAAAVFV
jgi:hypothetical protein